GSRSRTSCCQRSEVSMKSIGSIGASCLLVVLACASTRARAQALEITSLEHGAWADTVAALQGSPSSEHHIVRVVVRNAGETLRCGEYALSFDPAGEEAFAIGGCDPSTEATALELVSRAALFEPGGLVSRPRVVSISARAMLEGAAASSSNIPGGS